VPASIKRRVSSNDRHADPDPDCPDDLAPYPRETRVIERDSVTPGSAGHVAAESGPHECRLPSLLPTGQRDNRSDDLWRASHHAIDVRSVLGTVQGSTLRFDRARARPSGLDGACAQLADWQLRDGRRCDDAQLADFDY